MAKFESAESCTTSKSSKGRWRKFELCDTSATSKGKWWNFELLTESLVWHPGKIIDTDTLVFKAFNFNIFNLQFGVVRVAVDAGEDEVSEEVERDERHQQPVSLWSRQLSLGQVHRVEDADYSKNLSNVACKENYFNFFLNSKQNF